VKLLEITEDYRSVFTRGTEGTEAAKVTDKCDVTLMLAMSWTCVSSF
jgi:hypothetical protein